MPDYKNFLSWATVFVAVFVLNYGIRGVLSVIISVVVCFSGLFGFAYIYGKIVFTSGVLESVIQRPPPGLPRVLEKVKQLRAKPINADNRLTGSNTIDEPLQEIINFVVRDFVYSWYGQLTNDQEFPNEVRIGLQKLAVVVANHAKSIDWMPYITRTLVDEFASHLKLYRRACRELEAITDTKDKPDIESVFFDKEAEMEGTHCHDQLCTDPEFETAFLQELTDILLYLLLQPEEFNNRPLRLLTREVVISGILRPLIDLFADPDYINQTIIWLCDDETFNNETFLTVIKDCDSVDELNAVLEMVNSEINRCRSRDTGGDNDRDIKLQLSSLCFVKRLCVTQSKRLENCSLNPELSSVEHFVAPGQKVYSLPFDIILHNSLALDYFIKFMTSVGSQQYLFFYLNAAGYRASAEQQLSLVRQTETEADLELLRDAATYIFEEYLSDKNANPLAVDQSIIEDISEKIQSRKVAADLFLEAQAKAHAIMFDVNYPAFKRDPLYIRLLAELDLLREPSGGDISSLSGAESNSNFEEDLISTNSGQSGASAQSTESSSNSNDQLTVSKETVRSSSTDDVTLLCDSDLGNGDTTLDVAVIGEEDLQALPSESFLLFARINSSEIVKDNIPNNKPYAIYKILVSKHFETDDDGVHWEVERRYSDFRDLHMILVERFKSLAGLNFPPKKAFNNLDKEFLEKRRVGLDEYLQVLLNADVLVSNAGLLLAVHEFLQPGSWDKVKSQFSHKSADIASEHVEPLTLYHQLGLVGKMDTIVNPLKTSVRNMGSAMKSLPDNLVDSVSRVSGNLKTIPGSMFDSFGRLFSVKEMAPTLGERKQLESAKVGAGLDVEDFENIPLRIMLLLMDEVFDLYDKDQWFRRRVVAILRQILKATFGDMINRRIIEQVDFLTSPPQIAMYMRRLRDAIWPGGVLLPPECKQTRDSQTKLRTRVVCRAKMLGMVSDEMRRFIGTETTRLGVFRVFDIFQHPVLNRRLVYLVLEGILTTLFPDNNFPVIFEKFYSHSERSKLAAVVHAERKAAAAKEMSREIFRNQSVSQGMTRSASFDLLEARKRRAIIV